MSDTDKQINELFETGAHLGHKKQRIHPKTRKYIYKIENGVSIIDLTFTVDQLNKALKFAGDLGKNKKKLLVVGTKKIASSVIVSLCQNSNIPFINIKWPAGLLSNFDMIMKNVKKLITMREEKESGGWNKFVKHEQVQLAKTLTKLEKFYSGLVGLEKQPDALLVVDIKKEKNAVKEAKELNIPIIAIADTNADPNIVNYPIVANDDSLAPVEYLVKQIINSYVKGK